MAATANQISGLIDDSSVGGHRRSAMSQTWLA